MIEPLSETIFRSILVGLFLGLVGSISKKILIVIWMSSLFILIFSAIVFGTGQILNDVSWGPMNWICMLFFVNLFYIFGDSIGKQFKDWWRNE